MNIRFINFSLCVLSLLLLTPFSATATAETLALLRSPLSLGVPSATPGSDLGADNVAFGLEELKDDEDEDEDEDEDGFAK